jgi:selenocysteine lyase/cysteine desulfurase
MAEATHREASPEPVHDIDRRHFLSMVGKGLGLATLTSATVAGLYQQLLAAAQRIEHLPPSLSASEEDFWFQIQRAFTSTRSIINLNNGGVCPSPRMVTEAFVRYTWEQEDVPAYTMWQILEPQSENVRTGLARVFGRDAEEVAIVRNASEALETCLLGLDLKAGDEILTTTQDYPRMLTTIRQRELRDGIVLKQVKYPVPPKNLQQIYDAFEKGITPRTRVILVSQAVFLTGQITPVRAICELARTRNIECIVDGAHSFAHFDFSWDDIQCDYFGSSLHKWLYAPKGTGFLFVKREKIEKLWPLMAAERKQQADIRKFEEIGTHSAAMRLAIGEAILFHQGIGAKRKEERLRYLRNYWVKRIGSLPNVRLHTSLDEDQSCGIALIEIVGVDPGQIQAYLMNTHKIFTVAIVHDEFRGLRITPNVYTSLKELDRFCDVMETVARKGLPAS